MDASSYQTSKRKSRSKKHREETWRVLLPLQSVQLLQSTLMATIINPGHPNWNTGWVLEPDVADRYCTGLTWVLEQSVDFPAEVSVNSMRQRLRAAANARRRSARTKLLPGNRIMFRTMPLIPPLADRQES